MRKGLDTSIALGFLYLIRCSLHAAALKKNVANLVRKETIVVAAPDLDDFNNETFRPGSSFHRRKYSETLDVEHTTAIHSGTKSGGESTGSVVAISEMVPAKPVTASLQEILYPYGLSQYICALVGCFGVVPAVSATSTMYTVREKTY